MEPVSDDPVVRDNHEIMQKKVERRQTGKIRRTRGVAAVHVEELVRPDDDFAES